MATGDAPRCVSPPVPRGGGLEEPVGGVWAASLHRLEQLAMRVVVKSEECLDLIEDLHRKIGETLYLLARVGVRRDRNQPVVADALVLAPVSAFFLDLNCFDHADEAD